MTKRGVFFHKPTKTYHISADFQKWAFVVLPLKRVNAIAGDSVEAYLVPSAIKNQIHWRVMDGIDTMGACAYSDMSSTLSTMAIERQSLRASVLKQHLFLRRLLPYCASFW